MYPDFNTFKTLADKGNLIPVYREILADADTPVTAYLKIGGSPSFLLESVEGGEKWARYSFIGSRPSRSIRGKGSIVEIIDSGAAPQVITTDDPMSIVKQEISRYRPVEIPGLPRFFGGLVGYIGYDMVQYFETLDMKEKKGLGLPDFFLMVTDTMLIFDNLRQKIKVISNAHIEGQSPEEAYQEATEKINALIGQLRTPLVMNNDSGAGKKNDLASNQTREEFMSSVEAAKEYIKAGDVFQVVLSQRFSRPSSADPFNIYRALRVINPSPYMYFIDIGDAKIVGSSPEILVRLEGSRIVLRPIAGTRRRGETEEEDRALEKELKEDPKEVAEHIMLVDLGRNDVGRVSKAGSVQMTEMMAVERYSHVMHLVSNVEGELQEGLNAFDVLGACFPAGTVSGAPKVRAMEIINELEPTKRGPYAGSVGYFSYSGNMDTCITIRTLIIKDGTIYVQVGAGIVADSQPASEYTETVNKAGGMIKAIDMAEEGLG